MRPWRKYAKGILGTLAAIGVWIAAVVSYQPAIDAPSIPLWQCGINQWTLTNNYTTVITVSDKAYRVIILEGFRTDGASIPDSLAGMLGITRDHPAIIRGALIHDAMYAAHYVSRDIADLMLYEACIADGMDNDKAKAVWQAVHEWGFIAWDRNEKYIEQARRIINVNQIEK